MQQRFITNCVRFFITKCDIATFVFKNVAVITKCDDFMTICDSYYKMQHLLQIAIVHPLSLSQNVTLVHSFYLHKH